MTDDVFKIVFVCTGNRCRSPMGEGFVRSFARDLPVEVASAGLLDLGPVGAPAELLEVVDPLGVDLRSHAARALSTVDLSDTDLVIGFEPRHVAAAVVEAGVPHERAFTFTEIARLLEEIERPDVNDPVARARAAVESAHERRRLSGEFAPDEDVVDPFGGSRQAYWEAAQRTSELSRRLVAGLFS